MTKLMGGEDEWTYKDKGKEDEREIAPGDSNSRIE